MSTQTDYRKPHVFDPIHNGADECECGLIFDSDIHRGETVSHDTQVKQGHDVERWKRELSEAGWAEASATAWWDPTGGLYRGPYGAWKELQRRNGGHLVQLGERQ